VAEAMNEEREFPLADVLSITTPNLLSRRHMDGVIDLVNWMRGTDFAYDETRFQYVSGDRNLVDEARVCRGEIVWQHLFLAELQPPAGIDTPDLYAWLIHVERQWGDTVSIQRTIGGQ
jgi:hypothetical protein